MSILNHEIVLYTFKFEFSFENLLDFINVTCEIITRQNMTLGGQSLCSLLKIHMGAAEK